MTAAVRINGARHQNRFWEVTVMTKAGEDTRYLFLPDVNAVRREVERSGGYVISIVEKRHSAWQKELFSRDYKINFLKAMLFRVEVGSSPGQALMLVIEAEKNPRKRIDLEPALQIIKRGGKFSDAVEALSLFSKPIIAILQAGEYSGLRSALVDAIDLLETRKGIIGTITSAIGILGIDLFFAFTTCISVQWWALPALEKNVPQGATPEKIEQYRASIDQAYFWNGLLTWSSIAILAAMLFALVLMAMSRRVREAGSDQIARMPLIRRMVYDALLSDAFLLMARMMSSGMSLRNATLILGSVAPVKSLKQFWARIYDSLEAGESVAKAFNDKAVLKDAERMVFLAHQDTKQLVKIMATLSEHRKESSVAGSQHFMRVVSVIALGYILAAIGIAVMALKIQDLGLSASFDSLMN